MKRRSNPISKKPKIKPNTTPIRAFVCAVPVGLDTMNVVIKKILKITKNKRKNVSDIFICAP